MDVKPRLSLALANGQRIPYSQLEALRAVAMTRSQNLAAKELGIAVPVLHRYLQKAAAAAGETLVSTTPLGTRLTTVGKELLRKYLRYLRQLGEEDHSPPRIGCTPITAPGIVRVLGSVEGQGYSLDLQVADDHLNSKLFAVGNLDIVIFDDPLYIYESDISWDLDPNAFSLDLTDDTLIHVRAGEEYIRYRYGAQRLGFSVLDRRETPYRIVQSATELARVLGSGLSFFLNLSLIEREQLDLDGCDFETSHAFDHKIMALCRYRFEGFDALHTALVKEFIVDKAL